MVLVAVGPCKPWECRLGLVHMLAMWCESHLNQTLVSSILFWTCLGLDQYRAGTWYPILSAAAVPIPILEITSPIAWGKHVTNIAHTIRTFQNITSLTLCFKMYETNCRLETTGKHATVLTVGTGKRTTGIGTDAKLSIGRYRYPPILAIIGRYPIPDTGIGLT